MKRCSLMVLLVLSIFCLVLPVFAAPVAVQVGEFSVSGATNKDELKSALQSLLSSRLSGDGIRTVEKAVAADLQVSGSYTGFGATYSIDAVVKDKGGETVGRSFVQGQGQDELIPSIGKLAEQLKAVIKAESSAAAVKTPAPAAGPAGVAKDVVAVPVADIVRTAPAAQPVAKQTRIEGTMLGIAPVRTRTDGSRELVLANDKGVFLYRHGETVTRLAEYPLQGGGKILSIDTADADNDGQLELYVTVMNQEVLVSLVLAITDNGFAPVAEKLPYYFRAVAVAGGDRQLFAQQIGKDKDDFYGPVRTVVKKGNSFSLGEPVKLPSMANLYTFNRFRTADGSISTVIIDGDGNLRIYDQAGEELWKGNERFGGSEVYFQRDEQQMMPLSDGRYRSRFLEQRIIVTPNGEIVVPKNSGVFVVGNSRSYDKSVIFGFAWNGASLDERWHTKTSQSYLADYYYDAEDKSLVLLEQVQKSGILAKGASTISIKKVE